MRFGLSFVIAIESCSGERLTFPVAGDRFYLLTCFFIQFILKFKDYDTIPRVLYSFVVFLCTCPLSVLARRKRMLGYKHLEFLQGLWLYLGLGLLVSGAF